MFFGYVFPPFALASGLASRVLSAPLSEVRYKNEESLHTVNLTLHTPKSTLDTPTRAYLAANLHTVTPKRSQSVNLGNQGFSANRSSPHLTPMRRGLTEGSLVPILDRASSHDTTPLRRVATATDRTFQSTRRQVKEKGEIVPPLHVRSATASDVFVTPVVPISASTAGPGVVRE